MIICASGENKKQTPDKKKSHSKELEYKKMKGSRANKQQNLYICPDTVVD